MRGFRVQIVAWTVLLVGTVMVAVVIGTQLVLEQTEDRSRAQSWDILSAIGLVGVLGTVLSGVVAWRVSHRALLPVRLMAERAEEWSANDPAHRFDLGPPTNELSHLGLTLDHLLERVARALRDEQRLTAELAHEIRTPLTAIRGSAELAAVRPAGDPELRTDLTEIAAACGRLDEVVTALLDLARAPEAWHGTASPRAVTEACSGLVPPAVLLEVRGAAAEVAGSAPLVVRALAPLVENAGRHATSRVSIELRGGDPIEFVVRDDGPGVEPTLASSLFEPGVSERGAHGLGLGIARRAARSLGGDVVIADDAFVLRLPPA